jgi:hypothetical protein
MIPKILHYIWLSGEKIPRDIKEIMSSWEKFLPGYTIKHWGMSSFDVHSVPFVKGAIGAKKWAFASDYIRLYALYNEGGLYLDSDVLIKKNIDNLLEGHEFLSAVEYHPSIVAQINIHDYLKEDRHSLDSVNAVPGIGIQAAFMASVPCHPFVKDCMSWYENASFRRDLVDNDKLIAPGIYAKKAEKYGFVYDNTLQLLRENMYILSSDYIASSPDTAVDSSFAVHYCAGSWQKKTLFEKIRKKLNVFL